MLDEVAEDVTVQDGEVLASADVPEEVARLLVGEAVNLRDEPFPRGGGRPEALEDRAQTGTTVAEEPLSRPHDVRGLVVVEPGAVPQESRDGLGVTGPKQSSLRQGTHRGVAAASRGLDCQDAEAELLEELPVVPGSYPAEVFETSVNRIALGPQLATKPGHLTVAWQRGAQGEPAG